MLETLIFSTVLFVTVVIVSCHHRRVSLANPLVLYFLFHAVSYLWRAWRIYLSHDMVIFDWMLIEPTEGELIRTLLMCDLGLVAFWLGYSVLVPRRLVDGVKLRPLPLNRRVALLIGAGFTVLGLYAFYRFTWAGGLKDATSLVGGRRVMTGSSAYLYAALTYVGSIGTLWVGLFGLRPWVVAFLVVYYVLCMIRGGSRWAFLLGVLSVVFVDMWQRGRRWPRRSWVISGAVVLLLFGAVGTSRTTLRNFVSGQGALNWNLGAIPRAIERDMGTYDYLVYVAKFVPRDTGYSYGTQYLKFLTLPIPRVLWPGKPVGDTSRVDLAPYGNFFGAVVTVIGDTYLNAGWPTLALGMLLVGATLGSLHRLYQNHRRLRWVAVVYALFLSLLPQFYRDGGGAIFVFIFFHVGPAAFTVWLASRPFTRRAKPTG